MASVDEQAMITSSLYSQRILSCSYVPYEYASVIQGVTPKASTVQNNCKLMKHLLEILPFHNVICHIIVTYTLSLLDGRYVHDPLVIINKPRSSRPRPSSSLISHNGYYYTEDHEQSLLCVITYSFIHYLPFNLASDHPFPC
jgi:hypothetical protein